MPYLTPSEINSHLYPEIQEEISRGDAQTLQQAIDAATGQAYGYLSKYDRTAIFESTGVDRNPILLLWIKDIAVWHYIQLANPRVDMALRERRYEMAIEELVKIQNGRWVGDLPMPMEDDDIPQSGDVRYGWSRPQQFGHL